MLARSSRRGPGRTDNVFRLCFGLSNSAGISPGISMGHAAGKPSVPASCRQVPDGSCREIGNAQSTDQKAHPFARSTEIFALEIAVQNSFYSHPIARSGSLQIHQVSGPPVQDSSLHASPRAWGRRMLMSSPVPNSTVKSSSKCERTSEYTEVRTRRIPEMADIKPYVR